MKTKCPICGARSSPHQRGEPLRKFSNALRVLGLEGPYAHTSCLLSVLKVRVKSLEAQGRPTPVANKNPSQLLAVIEGTNE